MLMISKSLSQTVGVLLFCAHLSACVHPKVTYVTDPVEDYDGHIKFRLAATRLVIGEKTPDPSDPKKNFVAIREMKKIKTSQASVLEVLREDDGDRSVYAVVPQSQWLWTVETKLSVTYFDNTRLLQKFGTQVQDHRIEAIQAIGTIAKAAMTALVAAQHADDEIQIPVAIDADPAKNVWEALPSNPGWFYRVSLRNANPERDAVDRDEYFERYRDRLFSIFFSTRTLPTSSCKEANLEISRLPFIKPVKGSQTDEEYQEVLKGTVQEKLGNIVVKQQPFVFEDKIEWPVLIADYRYLRAYELPDKGVITMHTLCGADITNEKSDGPTNFQVLAEIVKQAKDIKDSQK